MDNRGVSPVVGKLLAAGLAVLYVSTVAGLFVGGLVPEYRAATGDELGERVLATAAGTVETAQPSVDHAVDTRTRTDLPTTIRGERYRLVVRNGTLVLDHPDDRLDARTRLALPPTVTVRDGVWHSGDEFVVRLTGPPGNRTLALGEGR